MSTVDPEIDELYKQILSGLDTAPDLELTNQQPGYSLLTPNERPPTERQRTSSSDRLMSIYDSYTKLGHLSIGLPSSGTSHLYSSMLCTYLRLLQTSTVTSCHHPFRGRCRVATNLHLGCLMYMGSPFRPEVPLLENARYLVLRLTQLMFPWRNRSPYDRHFLLLWTLSSQLLLDTQLVSAC